MCVHNTSFQQFEGNVIYQYKSDLYTFIFDINKETTAKELKKKYVKMNKITMRKMSEMGNTKILVNSNEGGISSPLLLLLGSIEKQKKQNRLSRYDAGEKQRNEHPSIHLYFIAFRFYLFVAL